MHAARVDQQTNRAAAAAAAAATAIDNSINASIQFSRVTNHSISVGQLLPKQTMMQLLLLLLLSKLCSTSGGNTKGHLLATDVTEQNRTAQTL